METKKVYQFDFWEMRKRLASEGIRWNLVPPETRRRFLEADGKTGTETITIFTDGSLAPTTDLVLLSNGLYVPAVDCTCKEV